MKRVPDFKSYQLSYADMKTLIGGKCGSWTIYQDEKSIRKIIENLTILLKYMKE